MQPNSEKQDFTQQNNNFGSQGAYPPHQGPPPSYSVYPQQPIGTDGYGRTGTPYVTQTPLPQQSGVIVVPVHTRTYVNRILTPISPNLKIFLLASGIFYALWGIIAVSLQVAILINSYSTYYSGFWTGIFLVVGGISMMVISCGTAYPLSNLTRMLTIDLVFCIIGLIFSIINYSLTTRCSYSVYSWYCDDNLTINLKIGHIAVFAVAVIHTIIIMVQVSREQTKALLTSNPTVRTA